MDDELVVRDMCDRDYRMIPVDSIIVVNSRNREKKQFDENIRSIRDVGLYKPIVVNSRNFQALGKYELICGEGRLIAHRSLGITEIKADVLDIDEQKAHLMTLGENIARTPPATIEFARSIKEMKDHGMSIKELCSITGKNDGYIRRYLQLIEQGEERLINGVESGILTITFAMDVASSKDSLCQNILIDAFDNGLVNSSNFARIKRIIEDRIKIGKQLGGRRKVITEYSVDHLKRDIQQITREKESYVYEAKQRENRAVRVIITFNKLQQDPVFAKLLNEAALDEIPALAGNYDNI